MTRVIEILKSSSDSMLVEKIIASFYTSIPKLKHVIDAGANHGFHFKRMSNLSSLKLCVGVEANPNLICILEKMLIDNKNALLSKALVGNHIKKKDITFKISEKYHGRGGIKNDHIWEMIDPSINFQEITVPVVSLDSLILNELAGKLDFIKMDLEGAELGVLLNTEEIWKKNTIIVMENSVHGPGINKISEQDWIDYLSSKSYMLVDFNFNECSVETIFSYNHVFIIPTSRFQELKKYYESALNYNYLDY